MLESSKFDCPILTEHNFIPCQRILMKFSENCKIYQFILNTAVLVLQFSSQFSAPTSPTRIVPTTTGPTTTQ